MCWGSNLCGFFDQGGQQLSYSNIIVVGGAGGGGTRGLWTLTLNMNLDHYRASERASVGRQVSRRSPLAHL